jgi:2-C-methyl-D-erythritol 4-phosphate cytidylyltransferase
MKTTAIIVAGGKAKRMGGKTNKIFLLLNGIPIIIRTLKAFEKAKKIDEIIIVANKSEIAKINALVKKYKINKVKKYALSGPERFDSVKSGVNLVGNDANFIIVHDACRPLIDSKIIDQAINAAKKHGAVIVAVPVKDTIKKVLSTKDYVLSTLDRKMLWLAQTPQVFRTDLIRRAFEKYKGSANEITDDAMLIEKLKSPVRIMMGSYRNIKITTKEDLEIAETLCA